MAEETQRYRSYQGWMGIFVKICAALIPLLAFAQVFDVPRVLFGVTFYEVEHAALYLALLLTLLFSIVPATTKSRKAQLAWYDILLVFAGLVGTLYIFLNFEAITTKGQSRATLIQQVLFFITLIAISEAVRRMIGWYMVIIPLIFFLHTKFAYLLPGLLGAPPFSIAALTTYVYLYDSGIFGMVLQLSATIIVCYMTFGVFLQEFGAGRFFLDLALSLSGSVRGGPAKVAVVSSAIFGMVSGSPTPNVATTGCVTIPLMKRMGYAAHFAGAVEAVASTGGFLMPPVMGAVAFIMAQFTGVGYGAVCVAAILPALLYYFAIFMQVDFRAAKTGLLGTSRENLPSLGKVMKEGWQYLLPIIMLTVLLMVIRYNALQTVAYSLIFLLILAAFKKETRPTPKKIFDCLEKAGRNMLIVAPVAALIGVVTGSIELSGLGVNCSVILLSIAKGNLLVLAIISAITIYISGMGIAVILIYILFAILIAPAMVQLGVPVLVAHMFIFYLGMSMFITPPNASAVWVACSIANSGLWQTGYAAMKLGIVAYLVPFAILYNPAFLLMGSPIEVMLAFATAVIGIIALAGGIEGYFLTKASWWQRILLTVGGLCLFAPEWRASLLSVAILTPVIFSQVRATRFRLLLRRASNA